MSSSGSHFNPRSTDATLPAFLVDRQRPDHVVKTPKNVASPVMPPSSLPVSVPSSASVSVMPSRSLSVPSLACMLPSSVSVMPPRSVSDSMSLVNVTSPYASVMPPRSVSVPSLVDVSSPSVSVKSTSDISVLPFRSATALSTDVTYIVGGDLNSRDAAVSRSLGMSLAGRRSSDAAKKVESLVLRGRESMHSFRAAKSSPKQLFWENLPKEMLQRPMPNPTADLSGLDQHGPSVDPSIIDMFPLPPAQTDMSGLGQHGQPVGPSTNIMLPLPPPELSFPLPMAENKEESDRLEALFGPETARRLNFDADPFETIETIVLTSPGTSTDMITDKVEDPKENTTDPQVSVHVRDASEPEDNTEGQPQLDRSNSHYLEKFSSLYHHSFRQKVGYDDGLDHLWDGMPESSSPRGNLTVRNL